MSSGPLGETTAVVERHRNDWRRTIVLFAVVGFTESLAFGHLAAFTPLFLADLRVRAVNVPMWTGLLSSFGFVIGLPLLPFWGVWADRYGRKIIIVRSSFFAAVLYAVAGASTSVWMLAFARFLGGFVLGNTGVMMAVQADVTPRERLGSAVAVISAGSPVGMAVGPYLGGMIVKWYGIRRLLFMDAGFTALVVLALIVCLREEPRAEGPVMTTREGLSAALKAIVHTPAVSGLFVVVFLFAFGMSVCQPYVPLLVESLFHGLRSDLAPVIGQVLTVSGITMAVTTPFWGRLGDRLGHLRVMRLCIAAVALSLAAQAMSGSVLQAGIARAAQGMFMGGLGALSIVLLAIYTPRDRRSAVLNMSLLPQQLSWFLGPLAGAALARSALAAPFWAGVGGLGLAWAASLRLPRPP